MDDKPVANYSYSDPPPREHQIRAFLKCYGLPYSALLMEQGTGKSKVAIDIASNLYIEKKINAVLLIAPNNVHTQWDDEQIPIHSSVDYTSHVYSHKISDVYLRSLHRFIDPETKGALKWFCVNTELFSTLNRVQLIRDYVRQHDTLIILDEATDIKNPDASRTVNIIQALSKVVYSDNGKRIISIEPLSKYRMILTGTIVTNAPFDAWAPFEFLHHDFFGKDFWSFKTRYGINVRLRYPGKTRDTTRRIKKTEITSVRKYIEQGKGAEYIAELMKISESSAQYLINNPSVNVPYKNLEELKEKIDTVSFTIRKCDCLDLPPKIYERVYSEMSKEQETAYRELKRDLLTMYKNVELTAVNKVTMIGRLQQITGGFFPGKDDEEQKVLIPFDKSPKLEGLIRDLGESIDRPIIVTARFTAEIRQIESALRKAFDEEVVERIDGSVSNNDRNEIRDRFNKGEVDFLVANAETIGRGLNLQICHTMHLFSNSYSLYWRAQLEDRIHRDGQTSGTVLYKDHVMKGTIDERVLEVLSDKRDLLDYMRDTDIGEFIGGSE